MRVIRIDQDARAVYIDADEGVCEAPFLYADNQYILWKSDGSTAKVGEIIGFDIYDIYTVRKHYGENFDSFPILTDKNISIIAMKRICDFVIKANKFLKEEEEYNRRELEKLYEGKDIPF